MVSGVACEGDVGELRGVEGAAEEHDRARPGEIAQGVLTGLAVDDHGPILDSAGPCGGMVGL